MNREVQLILCGNCSEGGRRGGGVGCEFAAFEKHYTPSFKKYVYRISNAWRLGLMAEEAYMSASVFVPLEVFDACVRLRCSTYGLAVHMGFARLVCISLPFIRLPKSMQVQMRSFVYDVPCGPQACEV